MKQAMLLVALVFLVALILIFVAAMLWVFAPGAMVFHADNGVAPGAVCGMGVSSYYRGVQAYRWQSSGRVEIYTLRLGRVVPVLGPLPLFDTCPHGDVYAVH